jgi:hypothetical protein
MLALAVLLLLIAGCSAPQTPNPTEIARLAAEAVKATLTAQPTRPPTATQLPPPTATRPALPTPTTAPSATPVPTQTPASTSTPAPTATATAQPITAPTGWRYYELISGEMLAAYPPDWKIYTENTNAIVWSVGQYSLAAIRDVTNDPGLTLNADAETQVRELKQVFLKTYSSQTGTTFPETGKLSLPGEPAYVVAKARQNDLEATSWNTFVSNGKRTAWITIVYIPTSAMPSDVTRSFTQFAGAIRFRPYVIPTTAPTPTADASPKAIQPGNLRAGPGTNYAVIGSVKVGDKLRVTGRSNDQQWLQIATDGGEAWISASLVESLPIVNLPVKTSAAPTVAPPPTAKPVAQFNPASFPQIGQEIEAGGWRFKVTEIHKRKAVYLYNTAYIAQGRFLVLIIEAVNLQPGTSYFAKDIPFYLTDIPGKAYTSSGSGSSYATWQYSKDSVYDNVNPGIVSRMAIAFDLPDALGDVLVSTGKHLKWIYLGNFAQMKSEDS